MKDKKDYLSRSAGPAFCYLSEWDKNKAKILNLRAKLGKIQQEAKKQLPIQDKPIKLKNFSKPQKQIIYLNKKAMFTKLKHLGNRVQVGKYRMLIEVQSNKWRPKIEKKVNKDEFSDKQYSQIYDEHIKGKQQAAASLRIANQVLSIYEMYDENDEDIKKSNQKFIAWRKQNCKTSHTERKMMETMELENSRKNQEFLIETNASKQNSDQLMEQYQFLAAKSKLFEDAFPKTPQDFIKQRFQKKFFCDRKKSKKSNENSKTIDHVSTGDKKQFQIRENKSLWLGNRFNQFKKEQKKIIKHSSQAGLSEQNKKKLQDKLEDIFLQINKPQLYSRKVQTSQTRRRNSLFFVG